MAEETTTIVIMGATGDLTQRKLLPALFQLACKGRLPKDLRIVGFACPTVGHGPSHRRYRPLVPHQRSWPPVKKARSMTTTKSGHS